MLPKKLRFFSAPLALFFAAVSLLPSARAADGFPAAAVPFFIGMIVYRKQAADLLHLKCVQADGLKPLGMLVKRIASLETRAAVEADAYIGEMQIPIPSAGDGCSGSFTTIVEAMDQRRARTEASADLWRNLGSQLQDATDTLLSSPSIRFVGSEYAGGGGGEICVKKAARLYVALTDTSAGVTKLFQGVRSSLRFELDRQTEFREKNTRLAANCGQSVPGETRSASATLAAGAPLGVPSGQEAGQASDITGLKDGKSLNPPEASNALNAPSFNAKEVADLQKATQAARASSLSQDGVADSFSGNLNSAKAGVAGDGRAKSAAPAGASASIGELLWKYSADPNRDDMELSSSTPAGQKRQTASAKAPATNGASAPEAGGSDLFQRVHACYRRIAP